MLKISDWHGRQLRLGIATDHGGMKLKERLVARLATQDITAHDYGAHVCDPQDDYPDFGAGLALAVARDELDCGILICRSGVGMGIVANRCHGVRAVIANTPQVAKASRNHNATNVLVIPADYLDDTAVDDILDAWLATPFSDAERHVRRLVKIEDGTDDEIAALRHADPETAALLDAERQRQADGLELIASENFASPAVRAAQASVLTNKYAEGYPGKRYYNGCETVDEVETLAIARACRLFGAEAANVQAHSGSQANMAAYFALIEPGDTVLAMSLEHGGHLTHGLPVNFSGMLYRFFSYGVSRDTETIDYDEVERLAREHRPKLIVAGASAYPRTLDFPRFRAIADAVGAKLMVDMAHIAGLVAAGLHPSPVPYAEVVTSTTHKTLRGPRSGLILCRKEFAKSVNAKIFPGLQGGPLMHTIAAKAVCFHEAMHPGFTDYQRQVVANAAKLATELAGHGFRIVSGGTDNHLMLVDLRPRGATGKAVATALDQAAITVNKNMIPFDPEKPFVTSGIRLGTPAVTTRGMRAPDMARIATWISRAVDVRDDAAKLATIADEIRAFVRDFPLPSFSARQTPGR